MNDYNQTLLQKELLWFQKSRSNWVQFGDRNTKYFHTTTIIRRRKNRVEALRREDGSWSFDAEEIKQMMVHHFHNVYTSDRNVSHALELCPRATFHFNAIHLSLLMGILPDEEVLAALSSIKPFKAPGPDGYQAGFYQQNWEKMK